MMWQSSLLLSFGLYLHLSLCAGCRDGSIRVVQATLQTDAQETRLLTAGRVQLCVGGHWTDICSSTFGANDDRLVACRQVNNENSTVTERNPSPTANVIVSVRCLAYEESLVECPILVTTRQSAPTRCTTDRSLMMNCPLQEPACKAGEILINSTNVVRVCYHGAWRFVCGDFWTDTQAVVVCRQLNRPTLGVKALQKLSSTMLGVKASQIQHTCTGSEETLAECQRSWLRSPISENCKSFALLACASPPHPPKDVNVTSLSSTAAQVSWVLQPNTSSDSFIITCNSSTHNTISLSGTLQSARVPQSNGVHTATVSGLDPDTLYTCCVTVRDEDVGSSSEKCVDFTGISSVNLQVTSTPTVTGGLNVAAVQAGSPAVGWAVGILIGVILGAVLTMVVLIVIVVILKRKNFIVKQRDECNTTTSSRNCSGSGLVELNNQTYEATTPVEDNLMAEHHQMETEPEYSYASTREGNCNVYESVPGGRQ